MPPKKKAKKQAPLKRDLRLLTHPALRLVDMEHKAMMHIAVLERQLLEFDDWLDEAREAGKKIVAQSLGDQMVPKTPKRRRNAASKRPTLSKYLEGRDTEEVAAVPARPVSVMAVQKADKQQSPSPVKKAPTKPDKELHTAAEKETLVEPRTSRSRTRSTVKRPHTAIAQSPASETHSVARPSPAAVPETRTANGSAFKTDTRALTGSVQKQFSTGKTAKPAERMATVRTPKTISKSALMSASRHAPISVSQQQQRVQTAQEDVIRRVEAQQQRMEEAKARKDDISHAKIEEMKRKREERERRAAKKREETARKELERIKRADEKKRQADQLAAAQRPAQFPPPRVGEPKTPAPKTPKPTRSKLPRAASKGRPTFVKQQLELTEDEEEFEVAVNVQPVVAVQKEVRAVLHEVTKEQTVKTSARPIVRTTQDYGLEEEEDMFDDKRNSPAKTAPAKKDSPVKVKKVPVRQDSPAKKAPVKPDSPVKKAPPTRSSVKRSQVVAQPQPSTAVPRTPADTTLDVSSYAMTPLRPVQPSTEHDYGIGDLNSGDETDDEEAPRKRIPAWAQGANLKAAIIQQHYNVPQSRLLLCEMEEPDLTAIFTVKRARFDKRTSSACWDSPLWNPTKAANYPRVPRPASAPRTPIAPPNKSKIK